MCLKSWNTPRELGGTVPMEGKEGSFRITKYFAKKARQSFHVQMLRNQSWHIYTSLISIGSNTLNLERAKRRRGSLDKRRETALVPLSHIMAVGLLCDVEMTARLPLNNGN